MAIEEVRRRRDEAKSHMDRALRCEAIAANRFIQEPDWLDERHAAEDWRIAQAEVKRTVRDYYSAELAYLEAVKGD